MPHSFETGWDGWTVETGTQWAQGAPSAAGAGSGGAGCGYNSNADPAAGDPGSNVLGTRLGTTTNASRYQNNQTARVVSPVVDCSKLQNVRLAYNRWLNAELAQFDDASIELSTDGGTNWTLIWNNNNFTPILDSAWTAKEITLPFNLADKKASVRLRYALVTDATCNATGWNMDRVRLVGNDVPPGAPTNLWAQDTAGDTGGSLTVNWTKSTDDGAGFNDVNGYEVWRRTAAGNFASCTALVTDGDNCGCVKGATANCQAAGLLGAGTQTYADTFSIANNTNYYYLVKVSDVGGNIIESAEAGPVQALDNTAAPSAPTLVSPADGSASAVKAPTLTWNVPTDPNNNLLHFKVEISPNPGFGSTVFTEEFGTATYYDSVASSNVSWSTTDGVATVLAGQGVADQVSNPAGASLYRLDFDGNNSQSFTPSGAMDLYSIDVKLGNESGTIYTYIIDLFGDAGGGLPDTANLVATVTANHDPSGGAAFFNFPFAKPLPALTGGTSYVFVIRALTTQVTGTNVKFGDSGYAGVCNRTDNGGASWAACANGWDLAFRTYPSSYPASGTVQSKVIASSAADITRATLTADHRLKGGTIAYQLSANDGVNWENATPGTPLDFANPGKSLKWRATVTTPGANVSPVIDRVTVEYTSLFVRESLYGTTGFSPMPPVASGSGTTDYEVQPSEALSDGVYYWRVSAYNGFLYGPTSAVRSFTVDTTPPSWAANPIGLGVADAQTGGKLNVSWTQSATDTLSAVSYRIHCGSLGFIPSGANLVTTVTAKSYADSGLLSGTQYCYRIVPADAIGNAGAQSEEVCATPTATFAYCTAATAQPHDFETTDGGWISGGTNNNWQWGNASPGGTGNPDPNAAFRGSKIWGTNLGGNYLNNSNSWVRSPALNCANIAGITLRYRRWLNFENGFDSGLVEASTDGFVSVINVLWDAAKVDPADTIWVQQTLALPAAYNGNANVQVRFRLTSDGAVVRSGWNVDYVEVYGTPTDTTPPTFSGSFTATDAGTGGRINLSWVAATDVSPPITYRIHRSTTSGFTPDVTNEITATTGTTYADTGLTNGTTFYYRIRAVDNLGNATLHTTQASAAPTAPPDTTPPTFAGIKLAQAVQVSGQAKVEFNAAADSSPPIKYNVYYQATASWSWATATRIANCSTSTGDVYALKCTVTGLTNGTSYTFGVRAQDSAPTPNEDANAITAAATPTPAPDTTPPTWAATPCVLNNGVGIQSAANTGEGGEVALEFNNATDATSPPVKFNVYYKAVASCASFSFPTATKIAHVAVAAGSSCPNKFVVTGLLNAEPYGFAVRAEDSAPAPNQESNTNCLAATPSDTQPPTWLSTVGVSTVTSGASQNTVAWGAASDPTNPVTFNLYRCVDAGGGCTPTASAAIATGLTSASTPYTDGGLTNGTKYCYSVRAQDGVSNVDTNTNRACATPGSTPTSPDMTSAAAADTSGGGTGPQAGDTVKLVFDGSTSGWACSSLDTNLALTGGHSWGAGPSCSWEGTGGLTNNELTVTVGSGATIAVGDSITIAAGTIKDPTGTNNATGSPPTVMGTFGTTRTWDNGGGDGLWSTPANWSGDTLPTSSNPVVFNGTSTANCTIDTTVTVAQMDLNSGYTGTVTLGGVTAMVNGNVTLGTGTLSTGTGLGTLVVSGNLTVNSGGTFSMPGAGTLRLSDTSALQAAYNATAAGRFVASSASATVTKTTAGSGGFAFRIYGEADITGLTFGYAGTNGLELGNWTNNPTVTNFRNVTFQNHGGAGTTFMTVRANGGFSMAGTGITFGAIAAGNNVKLLDDDGALGGSVVFATFGASGSGKGDTYEVDNDSNEDGMPDAAGGDAVVQWATSGYALDGAAVGFPTLAFDWNTYAQYAVYVAARDVSGASTADRVYVRDTAGNALYSYDIADGDGDILGTPIWDTKSEGEFSPACDLNNDGDTTDSGLHVLYVAAGKASGSVAKVFFLTDDPVSSALEVPAAGCAWNAPFTNAGVDEITSPLIYDQNNLYFGGENASDAAKIFGVQISNKALQMTVGAASRVETAPAWKDFSGTVFLYMGSEQSPACPGAGTAHVYRVNTVTGLVETDNSTSALHNVNGLMSLVSTRLYVGDDGGRMHGLNASSGLANLGGYPYRDTTNHAVGDLDNCVYPITAAPYVTYGSWKVVYGDGDGHFYVLNSTGVPLGGYPFRPGGLSSVFTNGGLSLSGVIVVGNANGKVYYIDESAASVFKTYDFGPGVTIGQVAYNANQQKFMIGTSGGGLYFLNKEADPTP
ncbi:MAG: hypothetical protein HYY13_06175 [Nitrospirae bacterium]|nr:hypothetical protein [Nitrospirota bacterium]